MSALSYRERKKSTGFEMYRDFLFGTSWPMSRYLLCLSTIPNEAEHCCCAPSVVVHGCFGPGQTLLKSPDTRPAP